MPTQISIDDLSPSLVTTISEAGASVTISSIDITDSGGNVLDDTAVSTDGGYIKINGTNFTGGASIIIGSTVATSVTYVSPTVYLAQVPAQIPGSYTVYLVASTGETATRPLGLTYSGTPAWVTGTNLTSADSGSAYSLQLNATGATSYALAAGSSLPSGLTLSSGGLISGAATVGALTEFTFTINAIDAELQDSPRTFTLTVVANIVGQAEYTTAGTYSWTVPAGVTSVAAVCVGAGAISASRTGGGGGGLRYINNLPVTPGETLSVVVGAPGLAYNPGDSSISRSSNILVFGGGGGTPGPATPGTGSTIGAGTYGGTIGGGDGGAGFGVGDSIGGAGGGGAGGYSGNGGLGGRGGGTGTTGGNGGSGGGGGGGGGSTANMYTSNGGRGGGVGIYGEGTSGSGGAGGSVGQPGVAGSGGSGVLYGGGGNGKASDSGGTNSPGGGGAVRIIWGAGRAFPSTNTTDQ